jgi:hypothetical protein
MIDLDLRLDRLQKPIASSDRQLRLKSRSTSSLRRINRGRRLPLLTPMS